MAAPTTYCVAKQSCVDAGGKPQPDLDTALKAAAGGFGTDRIELGAGDFHSPAGWSFNTLSGQNAVHIVGAGAGATKLFSDSAGQSTTLKLSGSPASSVRDLSIVQPMPFLPGSGDSFGLDLAGTAQRVDVKGWTCEGSPLALETGASFEDGHVESAVPCKAVVSHGSPATIAGSVIEVSAKKGTGVKLDGPGTLNVTRSRISASFGVSAVGAGTLNVDNSLIRSDVSGVHVLSQFGLVAVHLVNDTIAGNDSPGSTGIEAVAGVAGASTTVHVEDSILSAFDRAIATDAAPGTGVGVAVRYSNFTAATATKGGTIATSDHVLHVDPHFVDAAGGDYRLRADSPLLDAGTSDLVGQSNVSDLTGAPRAVAAPDLGAFEFQPHAPVAAIAGPDGAVVGQPVTFTSGGSSDPDPGDALTAHWVVDGTPSDGADAAHTFQTPGKATVELTVKDIGGQTSTVSKVIDVQSTPMVVGPVDAAPVVRAFSITKKRLALKARRHPAFRFKLSEDARVRISFALLGKKGRAAHVARALVKPAHAGPNRVSFSGRVGRRALKAGRYRATIVASDATGHASAPRSLKFTVVPA